MGVAALPLLGNLDQQCAGTSVGYAREGWFEFTGAILHHRTKTRGVVELISTDCDGKGLEEVWELRANPNLDCDGNHSHDLGDLQDPALDCDGGRRLDLCRIALEPSLDWAGNGVPDSCAGGGLVWCLGNSNTSGNVGRIDALGSPLIVDKNFTPRSYRLPIDQPGYYLFSQNSAYVNLLGGGAGFARGSDPPLQSLRWTFGSVHQCRG